MEEKESAAGQAKRQDSRIVKTDFCIFVQRWFQSLTLDDTAAPPSNDGLRLLAGRG